MNPELDPAYKTLQKLLGLHRQLLDLIRAERMALEQANIKEIQDITYSKEVVIHAVREAELERIREMSSLAARWKLPLVDMSLRKFIELIQGRDLPSAEKLRNVQNALKVLLDRIQEQNHQNGLLVQKSLEHVSVMKRNVLGEARGKNDTYTQRGRKSDFSAGARLLSKEV